MNLLASIEKLSSIRQTHRGASNFCALGLLALAIAFSSGCARLIVESNPPGAEVLWSPDGAPPWRAWPPLDWSDARARDDQPSTPTTPLRQVGPYGDYVFVTVKKPGYFTPRPRMAGLYIFRSTTVLFDLEETPGHFAQSQRDKGFVLYKGKWVDRAALGLVQFNGEWMTPEEKTKSEMTARGWVEWEGKWVTPAERELAWRRHQQSLGLIEFKGQWMTPEAAIRVRSVDAATLRLAESQLTEGVELSPPKVLGQKGGTESRIGFRNASAFRLRWLFSGPSSRAFDQAPQSTLAPEQFLLTPGRYSIAVFELTPSDPALTPPSQAKENDRLIPADLFENPSAVSRRNLLYLDSQPFTGGFAYSFSITPSTQP